MSSYFERTIPLAGGLRSLLRSRSVRRNQMHRSPHAISTANPRVHVFRDFKMRGTQSTAPSSPTGCLRRRQQQPPPTSSFPGWPQTTRSGTSYSSRAPSHRYALPPAEYPPYARNVGSSHAVRESGGGTKRMKRELRVPCAKVHLQNALPELYAANFYYVNVTQHHSFGNPVEASFRVDHRSNP